MAGDSEACALVEEGLLEGRFSDAVPNREVPVGGITGFIITASRTDLPVMSGKTRVVGTDRGTDLARLPRTLVETWYPGGD
jgi:hypothetical protein